MRDGGLGEHVWIVASGGLKFNGVKSMKLNIASGFRVGAAVTLIGSSVLGVDSGRAQLLNGDMAPPFVAIPADPAEGSVPSGWSALGVEPGKAGFYRGQSTENSPFTGVYSDNMSSVLIKDEAADSNNYGLFQNFADGYAVGAAGFDFKMEDLTSGYFSFHFNNNGNTNGGSAATMLRFYLNMDGYLSHQGAAVSAFQILPIIAGTWYNVAVSFDATLATYTGVVTPFGEEGISFSGSLVANSAANFSGVLVRDRTNGASGDLYIDNVYVVPEPAVVGMLVLSLGGCLCINAFRRRSLV